MVESILNKDVTMVQGLTLIIAIKVIVLAINLLGDGLRDALDPHMKR